MNLFTLLNRGAAHAPSDADRRRAREVAAAEMARAEWLLALEHDRLRAWMNIGEADAGLLNALVSMLTLTGMAHVHAVRSDDTPTLRILRGGISAATQCAQAGCIVTVDLARSWGLAIERAIEVVKTAPVDSIIHAAMSIRRELKLD